MRSLYHSGIDVIGDDVHAGEPVLPRVARVGVLKYVLGGVGILLAYLISLGVAR